MLMSPEPTQVDELQEIKARLARAERRARLSAGFGLTALALTGLLNVRPAALAQSPGVSLASLVSSLNALTGRVAALETKTASLTATGTPGSAGAAVTFSGVNVQVVDGLGTTSGTPNGLGNLVVGYDEARGDGTDSRTGSHNLILGEQNNFTSFGGLVGGQHNAIGGTFDAIVGGYGNSASHNQSAILGGYFNTASADYGCVTGGSENTASGEEATVTGGEYNTASGNQAAISGGEDVAESGEGGWAAGGNYLFGGPGPGAYHSP